LVCACGALAPPVPGTGPRGLPPRPCDSATPGAARIAGVGPKRLETRRVGDAQRAGSHIAGGGAAAPAAPPLHARCIADQAESAPEVAAERPHPPMKEFPT